MTELLLIVSPDTVRIHEIETTFSKIVRLVFYGKAINLETGL